MTRQATEPATAAAAPRKAIPAHRDRLQSRLLTAIVSLGLVATSAFGLFALPADLDWSTIASITLAFATITLALRAATVGGALSGALVCLSLTAWTADPARSLVHSALPPLAALFVLTFLATRAGRRRKERQGLAERRAGRRASQVLANLGIAALAPTPLGAYAAQMLGHPLPISATVLSTAAVAGLAQATADTVSSETGQAFGSRTFLITSFRRVSRGTDGGVSVIGTVSGLAAASLVVAVGAASLDLDRRMASTAILSATAGLLADSYLGASAERRGWIGNDLVNFASTAIAATLALLLSRLW
jgi:uncharacterized protein (TIGR00297 family)